MGTVTPKRSPEASADYGVPKAADPPSSGKAKRNIGDMPRDAGWLLVTAGLMGEIAPGVIGTPFWAMGTMILCPRMEKRVESWLDVRSPKLFRGGMRQIGQFLDDLERRYPLV